MNCTICCTLQSTFLSTTISSCMGVPSSKSYLESWLQNLLAFSSVLLTFNKTTTFYRTTVLHIVIFLTRVHSCMSYYLWFTIKTGCVPKLFLQSRQLKFTAIWKRKGVWDQRLSWGGMAPVARGGFFYLESLIHLIIVRPESYLYIPVQDLICTTGVPTMM